VNEKGTLMKKILFATDGSDYSHHAAKWLAGLPHGEPLEINVVSVVNTPQLYTDGSQAQWFNDYVQGQQQQAAKDFQEIQQSFASTDAVLNHSIRKGRVSTTILDAAKEFKSDLIVMGARGRSQVGRILLGSTSDYVATHAQCSVLVVRPSEVIDTNGSLKIALGYEDSGPAQAAVEELGQANWAADSSVHLVSVIPPLQGFRGDFDPNMETQANANQAIHRAASDLRNSCKRIRTQIVDHRHVGEGIVRFAEDNRCDLIAIGETPRSNVGRMLLGSVSRYVLRHAPCSVWITRNQAIKAQGNYPIESLQAT
jgi:nucleotide-binding universal stress UspA family protein